LKRPAFLVLLLLVCLIGFLKFWNEDNILATPTMPEPTSNLSITNQSNTPPSSTLDKPESNQLTSITILTEQQIRSLQRQPPKVLPENEPMRAQLPSNAMTLETLINAQKEFTQKQENEILKLPFSTK